MWLAEANCTFQTGKHMSIREMRHTVACTTNTALHDSVGARRPREEIYMTLLSAKEGIEYIIESIFTDDEELDSFLFSLGCYSGEPITVIARRYGTLVVSIKDARYTIDNALADAIKVKE